MKITLEIAERVFELQKQEYSYSEIFDMIQEEYPSLKLKRYSGAPVVLIRESHMLLNTDRPPHNMD